MLRSTAFSESATLRLQSRARRDSLEVIRAREAKRMAAKSLRAAEKIEALDHLRSKPVVKMSFGQWRREFGAVEARPSAVTPRSNVWTWVNGPAYHGDLDVIIPGYYPELAIKVFVTELPFETTRMEVTPY